jgi:hypothetical protein
MLLLGLTAIAAAFWRGRRFGPLVAENLPVTVKASETMEGRARLYARGNARLRALDALRIGAVQRLASTVGVGRLAPLEEIILSVAVITRRTPAEIRSLLVETIPTSDAQLLALSDSLQALESAASRAVAAGTASVSESSPPPVPPAHERMDP